MPLIDNMKEVSDEGKVVVSREREKMPLIQELEET